MSSDVQCKDQNQSNFRWPDKTCSDAFKKRLPKFLHSHD